MFNSELNSNLGNYVKEVAITNFTSTKTVEFDFSDVSNFKTLTAEDFQTFPSTNIPIYAYAGNGVTGIINATKSYNATTGILTLNIVNSDSGYCKLESAIAYIK